MQESRAPKSRHGVGGAADTRKSNRTNALLAFGSFFPFTAILHHAIFLRPTCILNNFGPEYTLEVLANWLRADPSPYVAVVCALVAFVVITSFPGLRLALAAFLIATVPLTIWIWDIPFTGRIVCMLGHDGRWVISSQDLYLFAAIVFAPIWYWLWKRSAAAIVRAADAWSR